MLLIASRKFHPSLVVSIFILCSRVEILDRSHFIVVSREPIERQVFAFLQLQASTQSSYALRVRDQA